MTPRCAVIGCERQGRHQVCPYDGRYHGHGRIHYECDSERCGGTLQFHQDAWGLICDLHYAELLERAKAHYPAEHPAHSLVSSFLCGTGIGV